MISLQNFHAASNNCPLVASEFHYICMSLSGVQKRKNVTYPERTTIVSVAMSLRSSDIFPELKRSSTANVAILRAAIFDTERF